MHTMSARIDTRDSYVTPVPDPRLAKTGNLRIAHALSANTTSIATTTATSHLPTPNGPLASACCDMQIGDEIITYAAVSPSGLTGVQRGAYNTHQKRSFCAILYHKANIYQDRLGTNIGKVATKETFLQARTTPWRPHIQPAHRSTC